MDLMTKVVAGLGPSVYQADAGTVAASDPDERVQACKNFLMGKFALADGPALGERIAAAVETCGRPNRSK